MPPIKTQAIAKKEQGKFATVVIGPTKKGRHFSAKKKPFTWKAMAKMTPMQKVALTNEKISKKELEELKKAAGLDYSTLSKILSVARATLINKKGTAKFNEAQSERILALADIYAYGYAVFEDEEKFNRWVAEPNKALGGQNPLDLLYTQFGREEVKRLIGRIEYGVYS
jgi:putative toxin-antitoxin system antitoxin component (TIGR02293 family)